MKQLGIDVDPDITVTSQQLEHQLDSCDPLACVMFSHAPSVQMYYALRSRLESCSEAWLQEFISLDGLDSLLDSLGHMCGPQFNGFSDAILQIDCLSCIRAILNSKIGMTALINSENGTEKLLKGVELVNTLPRKHVFEILSAVCVYNSLGYKNIMAAIEKHRQKGHHVHKLSFIVNELKMAETIPHKTSLLTFINAIVSSTPNRPQRCQIRNELAGLGLLDVISFLQREETDEDLCVQLQVFQDKRHDDEAINTEPSIDFNCPQELVDIIQTKVFGGPKMVCFVNILQDLLAVETSNKEKSDTIWKVLERHVHHIVHSTCDIESQLFVDTESACEVLTAAVESDRLLSSFSYCSKDSHAPKDFLELPVPNEKRQRFKRLSSTSSLKKESALKTSADSGFIGCEEKLSPSGSETISDNLNMENKENFIHQEKKAPIYAIKNISSKENYMGNVDKGTVGGKPSADLGANLNDDKRSKQKQKHLSVYDNMSPEEGLQKDEGIKPDTNFLNNLNIQCEKLTGFNFVKPISENDENKLNAPKYGCDFQNKDQIVNNGCANENSNKIPSFDQMVSREACQVNEMILPTKVMRNLKWIKLDETLIDEYPQAVWAKIKTEDLKMKPNFPQVEEMFQEQYDHKMAETPLLSMKTRLSLNLFLHRCEEEPVELVKKLVRVDGPGFSLPFIKHLTDIIPEPDEVKHLKFYNGNLLELGQAEQFVLHLSDVPNYNIVLNGQLQKAEFRAMASRLRMVLSSMLESSKVILSNEGVKETLLLILRLGNFCNHGQFNGYASGFKLSSLIRLSDLKSKESGHTFVHYLVTCFEANDDNFLSFLNDIPKLEKAASQSLSSIKCDFDKMNAQINSFVRQLATANPVIRSGFDGFLEEVKREFRNLQSQISELKVQSKSLAAYFCESDTFELQSCFKALLHFFQELRLCKQEVKQMRFQKQTAAKHTQMFSQQIQNRQMALHFGQKAGASSSMMEEKKQIVDILLAELHRGNFSPVISDAVTSKKGLANKPPFPPQQPLASTMAVAPSIIPVQSAPCIGVVTPERNAGNGLELSRITLMGTPMMNRPNSEMFEEEITINAPKPITSSENDLLDGPGIQMKRKMKAPAVPLSKPLTTTMTDRRKGHHRSRSDLADSINVDTKWIRYHDQLKLEKAPLAKPESSIMVATLNLEAGNITRHLYQDNEGMALMAGPIVELPTRGNTANDLNKQGKKSERRSTISRMINKISRRVLKPRNVDVMGNADSDENIPADVKKMEKRQVKMVKAHSVGRTSGLTTIRKESEKENICGTEVGMINAFDRQSKNPIRLSNRFKSKFIK